MKGIFYKAKEGSWVSKTIACITWTDRAKGQPAVSHYEHWFNEDRYTRTPFYSASEQDGCTRFKGYKDIHVHSGKWVTVPLHLSTHQVLLVRGMCVEEEGRDYDLFGALCWHTPYQNPIKDFCSEQGARHLIEVGYIIPTWWDKLTKWSPNKLLKRLIKIDRMRNGL